MCVDNGNCSVGYAIAVLFITWFIVPEAVSTLFSKYGLPIINFFYKYVKATGAIALFDKIFITWLLGFPITSCII